MRIVSGTAPKALWLSGRGAAVVLVLVELQEESPQLEGRTYLRLDRGDDGFDEFPSEFQDFTIYWVGEEFAGHRLRRITRVVSPPQAHLRGEDEVSLISGTCEIEPGPDGSIDGGCPPPIQIINQPHCMVPPELIGHGSRPSGIQQLRGGAEALGSSGDVRLWTSDVTVKVYTPPELTDATLDALDSPNGQGVGAGEDMPPPVDDCPPYHTPDVSELN